MIRAIAITLLGLLGLASTGVVSCQDRLVLFSPSGDELAELSEGGSYSNPSFSPDTNRVAAIRHDWDEDIHDLWVFDTSKSASVQITHFQAGEQLSGSPVWSPDGRQVAFQALRNGYFTVYRAPSDGSGDVESIYEHPGNALTLTGWSADGLYLSVLDSTRFGPVEGASRLTLLPIEGGAAPVEVSFDDLYVDDARSSPDMRYLAFRTEGPVTREIVVLEILPAGNVPRRWRVTADGGHGMITWRPDSSGFYFLAGTGDILQVSIDGDAVTVDPAAENAVVPDEARGLLLEESPDWAGTISADGRRLVFDIGGPPTLHQITVFDRAGNVLREVGPPGLYLHPVLSPDGSLVAVVRRDPDDGFTDIWTFSVATGEGRRVTRSWYWENDPAWHPDGRVAYETSRETYFGIYARPWDGSGPEELLYRHYRGTGLNLGEFSQDGRLMTFTSGGVVYVVRLEGEDPLAREAVEFGREEFAVSTGRIAPNASMIAYHLGVPDNPQLYVREIDATSGRAGDNVWQVSRDGSDRQATSWRSDGRELYFAQTDAETDTIMIMAVSIETVPAFAAGEPQLLFSIPSEMPRQKFASPDGERFVFLVPVESAATSN